ncbi:MAG: permease, partial [Alphaproteobacteria bacterium]|nr:permease [Alphaproteobacteria bacterium]
MSLAETLSPPPSPWRRLASTALGIDRVILALVALVLGLAILAPDQAVVTLDFVARNLGAMVLWLVPAIGFAAWAKATGADRAIAAAFAGHPTTAIVLAALVGALSPLCSCGVVALIVSLLKAGVPVAPVMAFWIASPLMDPGMFLVTWGGLGLEMALVKTVAAIAMGLLAGGVAAWVLRSGLLGEPLRPAIAEAVGSVALASVGGKPVLAFWRESHRRAAFVNEARKTTWFLLRWLALAFAVESLMIA